MSFEHPFTKVGLETGVIPVHLSFRIIELFSEGLYQSPQKALEELVANAFDADARNVHVVLTPDRLAEDAFIAVVDDGTGMDADGLRQHWLIGDSNKRDPKLKPKRKQIGRFGIGKLATFVLAHHLTHISKKDGRFYAITMNYRAIPKGTGGGLKPTEKDKVELPLRVLTEDQAKEALETVLKGGKAGHKALRLFGSGARPSWTAAIMSDLKPLAAELRHGRLEWVLRTAMPLQDDFRIFLDGEKLEPAAAESKGRLKRWVLGQDITKLEPPAPEDLSSERDASQAGEPQEFGLTHPALGRVTGYAEVYEDLLTDGKAAELGRSHGFFVYARKRLINLDDALFGLPALRHGTFARFRAVLYVDRLDDELRSSRETVRDGPLATTTRNILHAIFNVVRIWHEDHQAKQQPGQLAVSHISGSPGSLTGRPIINLVSAAFDQKVSPRFLTIPQIVSKEAQQAFLKQLEVRADSDAGLVSSIEIAERSPDLAIANLDVASGVLRINALHPFVAANRDDYEGRRETFGLLAMADVLTEAYLFQAGVDPADIAEILSRRDELLRQFARSLPRTPAMVARALEDAATDKAKLELELVACFDSMGLPAIHLGGPDKPDGRADGCLGGQKGEKLAYSVSLEAKSKQKTDEAVSAKDIGISRVARHRDDLECEHAVVVAPEFPTSDGEDSAVIREARADRTACRQRAEKKEGKDATITLIRIHDMARLVRLVSSKCVGLDRLRQLFLSCVTPKESKEWIDALEKEQAPPVQFREVLETIWEEQKEDPLAAVEFGSVRTALRLKRKIVMEQPELIAVCQALSRLAPNHISVRTHHVELRQRPDKVLEAASESLRKHPEKEQKGSAFPST